MHKKRIYMFFRNTVSIVLALSLVFGDTVAGFTTVFASETATVQETEEIVTEEEINAGNYGLADNIQDGTILHCFDWKYNDIKAMLPQIAEAGFTSVQTSPAQKGCGDDIWYKLYQPLGFWIGDNALGSKSELQALCTEADKYGIKVIVDVVANHLAGDHSNIDDGLKASEYWHHSGYNSDNIDWTNRWQVTQGEIGMPDLNSEHSTVQQKVASYIDELKGVGVDGIRWDAAKHISLPSESCGFWSAVTNSGLYNYGEILEGPVDPTEQNGEKVVTEDSKRLMKEYTQYMSVTDNNYGSRLMGSFRDGQVPTDSGYWSGMGISPNKMIYWAESHDTYSNNEGEGGWTKYIDENAVDRAYAIAAGRADASALYFSRPNEKAKDSIMQGAKGSTRFTSKQVAEVNHLHNATIGQRDYYVYDSNANVAAVCRETGAVIVKGSGNGQVSISNGGSLTKPGTYTDKISGNTFTVTSSNISGNIGDTGIAVIYEESNRGSINASMADGASFTTDSVDVTFTVKDASNATYAVDGKAAVSFQDSVKLTLGESTDFGGKVKVVIKATGADGSALEKTFTYTKKEAGKVEKNTVYFTKPSGWSGAYIYAYVPGTAATKLTGEWPGTAMAAEEDGVYTYTFEDSVSTAKVIFAESASGSQTPLDVEGEACGYDYTGGKAYTYDGTWKEVSINNNTPTNTTAPTGTNVPSPTQGGDVITVDFADGSSFDTETKTVKITVANNAKGTYCVDDGPEKEFTGTATVVLGKGKIADSDVTLKVTVNNRTKTYTYRKVFNTDTFYVKTNAAAEEENVVEAPKVNAAAETGGMYATNPNGGVGKEKTIKSMADFDADCLVAQSGAWDVPNTWNGAHENSVADCYGLYAAWDDTNLYVGVEYVNTTDTWQREGEASLMDNGKMSNVPVALAINAGTKTAMTGKMEAAADDDYIWGLKCEFETRVDHLLIGSAQVGSGTPGLFVAKSDGTASYDPEYCLSFKENGITYQAEDGSISSSIMHLKGSQSVDDAYDSSKYVDALTDGNGHNRKYDTFFTYTIPLSVLGIDKATLTSNGIGIMGLATRGESCMDSVPHDPSMLDNTMEAYRAGDNTSYEKEDLDIITVPLASVGKLNSGGGGDITPIVRPTSTTAPTAGPTTEPNGLAVNFGADRSAPQYNTTELAIKAEVTGGNAPYTYEFFVDDKSVQKGEKDTYTWKNDTAGAHTITAEVTDSKGVKQIVTKDYDLEKDEDNPNPTTSVSPTPTTVPTTTITGTVTPIVTDTPSDSIEITKFVISCKTSDGSYKVGDKFTMEASASNADGAPKYMFTYILNGEEVIVKNYDEEATTSFVPDTAGIYLFKVYVVDNSNDHKSEFMTGSVEIAERSDITGVPSEGPDITDTPVITGGQVVTLSPTPTSGILTPTSGIETPTPTSGILTPTSGAVTPTPTHGVIDPIRVSPTATSTPIPTRKPTVTTAPVTPKPPVKGTVLLDEKSNAYYKVVSTGSTRTVQYSEYDGSEESVTIPSTITINKQSYKVTSIADSAFKNNKKLKKVYVGKNVTTIGKSAFSGCTALQKVTGCTNVKTIKDKAFYGCKKLTSMAMKSSLTSIGKSAFYKCTALKKITIPAKVSKIGSKAFYGCKNLKTITIKTTKLTTGKVGSSAFKNIYKKATVKVPSKKVSSYKTLLKKKGLSSSAKVKK